MQNKPLRIVFAGTPDFAATHLKALIESEHQLLGVYTQPDRPAGRGKKLHASPVKQAAQAAAVPIFQPSSLKPTEVQQQLADLGADVMVVVAYGLILPQAVLDIPALGCLNVHASLLPRWRGAAPIQRAIEAGDTSTGITIMQMDAGLDTGDMLASASCDIGNHTAGSLHDELAGIGAPLLLEVLRDLKTFQEEAQAQDDSAATYAAKISKAEALVDWTESADVIAHKTRAFNPFPVSYSTLGGDRVRLWRASAQRGGGAEAPGTIVHASAHGIAVRCGSGHLLITELQLPGGKALSAQQIMNAKADLFCPGQTFGAVQ
ncbi:MAG: methionyl-tRNA formyltransferase [Halioglobus sp.]